MPTPTRGRRLGGSSAHQRHILANLATALFEHGKITTTEAKARRLRPFAERLITFAKRGDLHARREVLAVVTDKGVVHTLFTEIGPRFAARDGGYTRITKVGPRKGDNAPLAVIELVSEEATVTSRRRRTRRAQPAAVPARAGTAAPAEGAAAGAGVDETAAAGGVEAEGAAAGGVEAGTVAEETAAEEAAAGDTVSEAAAEDGSEAAGDEPAADGSDDESAGTAEPRA